MRESEIRTSFLITGGGTTMESAVIACQNKKLLGIKPVMVISSRPDAGGLMKAEALGIPTEIVVRKDYPTLKAYGEKLLSILKPYQTDLVSLNGFLPLVPPNVIEEFKNMIINQHPGPLDPGRGNDFGGRHMHGSAVTCAVILFSWLTQNNFFTEATTHLVLPEVDKGDLIRVVRMDLPFYHKQVNIADMMHNETLQALLKAATEEVKKLLLPIEHENVIETLRLYAEGKVQPYKREKPLINKPNIDDLEKAKSFAVQLFPNG